MCLEPLGVGHLFGDEVLRYDCPQSGKVLNTGRRGLALFTDEEHRKIFVLEMSLWYGA